MSGDYDRIEAWKAGIRQTASHFDVEINEHIMTGERIRLALPEDKSADVTVILIEEQPCGKVKRIYFK